MEKAYWYKNEHLVVIGDMSEHFIKKAETFLNRFQCSWEKECF